MTQAAAYEFDVQVVTLDLVDSQVLGALQKHDAPGARYKVLRLAAHEYTHCLDHIATLWGRRILRRLYAGKSARYRENVDSMHLIVDAWNDVHRVCLAPYYHMNGPKVNAPAPWTWALSVGLRFDVAGRRNDDAPICFLRLGSGGDPNDNDNLVARVHLAPVVLSEVRAMAAEYSWVVREAAVRGKATRNPADWLKEYGQMLYAPEYAAYSAALHVLANHCGAREVHEILEHASRLASIAFNLPDSLWAQVRIPEAWDLFRDRLKRLLDLRDPAALFLVLCARSSATGGTPIEVWIDNTVQAAGLPPIQDIETAWKQEIESVQPGDVDDPQLHAWLDWGALWATRSGLTGLAAPLLASLEDAADCLPLPPVLTGEDDVWCPTSTRAVFQTDDEFRKFVEQGIRSVNRMSEFLAACGRLAR